MRGALTAASSRTNSRMGLCRCAGHAGPGGYVVLDVGGARDLRPRADPDMTDSTRGDRP